jgi:nicotinamidase/pyrazinamidase
MNALVLVDIQNDFLPDGALPVAEGDQVVAVANRVMDRFDLVVATQDWHPADHGSFAANHAGRRVGEVVDLHGLSQILWPVHCVQGTRGADFAPGLDRGRIDAVFRKGTDPSIDSYSGFFDNGHRKATGLGEYLRARGAETVYIMGLATDYCVKFTALDAVREGFTTVVIEDGCRGVEARRGDVDAALAEMRAAGVAVVQSADVPAPPVRSEPHSALTLQFLAWIAERPRTYQDVMEVWRSTCPRRTVWEDTTRAGLVRFEAGDEARVSLTARGERALSGRRGGKARP